MSMFCWNGVLLEVNLNDGGSPDDPGQSSNYIFRGYVSGDIFVGTSDYDYLVGTGEPDIIILDKARLDQPSLLNIDQIETGAGDDVVDLTSLRFFYPDVVLSGGDGSDWLWGNAGNDRILGGSGNDCLSGNGGNDHLIGDSGRDCIDGGAGIDTAIFAGERSSYSIGIDGNGLNVQDESGDIDRLIDIERVEFADGSLVFDVSSDNAANIYRLYQAAFARIPDETGFRYWVDAAEMFDIAELDMASAFRLSFEFIDLYGSNVSNYNYVYNIYKNVLQREPDGVGIDYWTQQLDLGWVSRDQMLIEFAQSAENVALTAHNTDAGYLVV